MLALAIETEEIVTTFQLRNFIVMYNLSINRSMFDIINET